MSDTRKATSHWTVAHMPETETYNGTVKQGAAAVQWFRFRWQARFWCLAHLYAVFFGPITVMSQEEYDETWREYNTDWESTMTHLRDQVDPKHEDPWWDKQIALYNE